MGQPQSRPEDERAIRKLTEQLRAMELRHEAKQNDLDKNWVDVGGDSRR